MVIIGEVIGMHHQLGGSTEDDMNKMSVIGHFFLIRLLAVRWAGSYNDNVLSALPWVRRHRPWWNKLLGIRGPSSGRHGREVLLAAHFVGVLCVVLRDFRKMWIHIISIHMLIWIHICRIRTAYLWQITWIVLRDVFLASIFLAYNTWNQHFFFAFARENVWRQMEKNARSS